jgi:glycosyltransferase involved in cell wall biosynthesis
MKKPVLAITDFQLKEMRGGGQKVTQLLVNSLQDYYPVIYIGGHPNDVVCKEKISPYTKKLTNNEGIGKFRSNPITENSVLKRIIRYAFHKFRFLSNRLLRNATVSCDIAVSNSNYDDMIMLEGSRFHLNYKGAIFIKHAPYFDFGKIYPDRLIKDKIFRIIALNSVDYKLLSIKYSRKNVRLIYPILDSKKVKAAKGYIERLGIQKRKKVIFSIGRLDESQKKLSIAIKAMSTASKLNDDLVYIIAGDGQDRKLYEKMISSYGLTDKIKMVGFVTDEEKRALFERADLVLQPSLKENFSSVTLEALNYGALVLTSRNSGSIDLISEGKNGFFLEITPEDIAAKMLKIVGLKEAQKNSIRKNAFRTASRFSTKKMIQQYKEVINELASEI